MNCKHLRVKGRTTKYFYCMAKSKPVDERNCNQCMLRITDMPTGFPKEFEEIFGKGFKR